MSITYDCIYINKHIYISQHMQINITRDHIEFNRFGKQYTDYGHVCMHIGK